MKYGVFNVVPKVYDKVCSGNSQYPHDTSKARMSKSQMKTMSITVFDINDIVHFEFIPQGQQSTKLFMWKY